MLDWLYSLDLRVLKTLNADLAVPELDSFWNTLTQLHKQPWFMWILVPILLLSLLYIYRVKSWQVLVAAGLAMGLADALAYRVIKSMVKRVRPFDNPDTAAWLRHVGVAHGTSFPSNHAANMFAGALILACFFPRAAYFFYIFAGLVALSRVMLGVHYPSDVLVGAGLGIFVGFLVKKIWIRIPGVSFGDSNSSR